MASRLNDNPIIITITITPHITMESILGVVGIVVAGVIMVLLQMVCSVPAKSGGPLIVICMRLVLDTDMPIRIIIG